MASARMAAAVLAILFSLATSTTAAQSATGDVQGTVINGAGAVLSGVTVTITNTANGFVRETFTDHTGFFAVPGLPPGHYELHASAQGFATRRQPSLVVQAGQIMTLRLELGVAPAPETITVADPPPMVETTRSQVSSVIVSTEVEDLPLRGRNALRLPLLVPGVAADISGGDISVAGQHGTFNRVVIDGADHGRPMGASGWISQEATYGVQVNTASYAAEYGRAAGGIVHLVTKSGSNELSGSAFAFRGTGGNTTTNQFGATGGGPVVRDRHFGFALYEGMRHTAENAVFLNVPPTTPSDATTRAAVNRLESFAAPWERRQERDWLLAKTDHHLSDAHRLALRYQAETFAGRGLDPIDEQATQEAARTTDTSAHAFSATAASTLGAALFNEARVHLGRSRETGGDAVDAPQATIRQDGSDVFRIGGNALSSGNATVTRLQVADTLTWLHGAHKLKTGFDVAFDRIRSTVPGNFSGAYVFTTLASFGHGIPSAPGDTYTQAFERAGTAGRTTRPNVGEYSLFVQDEWRVNHEVTINAGVRYDAQTIAQPDAHSPDAQLAAAGVDTSAIRTDSNNFGPRIGFAWTPPATRFVVRGGYGIVYGRTPWPMIATAHAYNGINVQTITVRGATGDPLPAFPNRFATVPPSAVLRPTIVAFDANFQNPRVQQASAGFEWEWMPNTAFSVNYLVIRGDELPRATDRNVGSQTPATFTVVDESRNPSGTIQYDRFSPGPYANFARVISYQSTAQSRYHGVTAEMTRRFSQGHQYGLSYTLGRTSDTVPDATVLVPESTDDRKFASNPIAVDSDRGPGRTDHRHRFVASFIYDSNRFAERYDGLMQTLFSDWTLSAIYTVQTGVPFSAYVSGDINGDGNRLNDLAPGTTRHQNRLSKWMSLDPRLARDIELKGDTRVTLMWEAFNLLNRPNHTAVNDTMYHLVETQLRANPLFGQALGWREPRVMQLAARVSF